MFAMGGDCRAVQWPILARISVENVDRVGVNHAVKLVGSSPLQFGHKKGFCTGWSNSAGC